jgi:hypothetical protein
MDRFKYKQLVSTVIIFFVLMPTSSLFAATITYVYDDLNRLERVIYENNTAEDYYYDEVSNREDKIISIADSDNDGIPDDGDRSGVAGDHPCTGGTTTDCDDNCVDMSNPNQADPDSDGLGNECDDDDDNDGLTDAQEAVLGTNPLNPDTDADGLLDGADNCPLSLPVRIAGATPIYYSSIQTAYGASVNGDLVQSQSETLTGDINFDSNISLTLQGGNNCGYTMNSGNTILNGTMTISNGVVIIENIVLQ